MAIGYGPIFLRITMDDKRNSQDKFTDSAIETLLHHRPGGMVEVDEILIRLPIDPYQHVADIGCGPGFFSLSLAKSLSHGKLLALDTDEKMLDVLRQRLSVARLSNVEVVKCGGTEFPLAEASLDGIFQKRLRLDREAAIMAASRFKNNGSYFRIVLQRLFYFRNIRAD
ncbi:class I SAM-dependent methyltransferase, partial [SAR202 cluster bacterium AD-804-J14_MRT_500m]|nr:class I SAM-dependent methyltransferase [SAR202 cluster bacterium AD-804-J14_MRT_500m]